MSKYKVTFKSPASVDPDRIQSEVIVNVKDETEARDIFSECEVISVDEQVSAEIERDTAWLDPNRADTESVVIVGLGVEFDIAAIGQRIKENADRYHARLEAQERERIAKGYKSIKEMRGR